MSVPTSSVLKFLWSIISLWLLSSLLLVNQAAGSLSLLNDGRYEQPDLVIELDVTNFDSVLKDTTANYTIVEFYAHWSPACRRYKPQYEKVASLFNGADAVYPGIVLVTRIDCAIKANTNLCDKFCINYYPVLFWGAPTNFVAASLDGTYEKSEICTIKDGRTAQHMLKWINTQLGSSYDFEDEIIKTKSFTNQMSLPLDRKYESKEPLRSNHAGLLESSL